MEKAWSKPKLIVLFRGRPEERVLGCCKNGSGDGTNSQGPSQGNCAEVVGAGGGCEGCTSLICS